MTKSIGYYTGYVLAAVGLTGWIFSSSKRREDISRLTSSCDKSRGMMKREINFLRGDDVRHKNNVQADERVEECNKDGCKGRGG